MCLSQLYMPLCRGFLAMVRVKMYRVFACWLVCVLCIFLCTWPPGIEAANTVYPSRIWISPALLVTEPQNRVAVLLCNSLNYLVNKLLIDSVQYTNIAINNVNIHRCSQYEDKYNISMTNVLFS